MEQIEKDVRGLAELMHEMHDLVQDQKPELDSIEEMIKQSKEQTAEAEADLAPSWSLSHAFYLAAFLGVYLLL